MPILPNPAIQDVRFLHFKMNPISGGICSGLWARILSFWGLRAITTVTTFSSNHKMLTPEADLIQLNSFFDFSNLLVFASSETSWHFWNLWRVNSKSCLENSWHRWPANRGLKGHLGYVLMGIFCYFGWMVFTSLLIIVDLFPLDFGESSCELVFLKQSNVYQPPNLSFQYSKVFKVTSNLLTLFPPHRRCSMALQILESLIMSLQNQFFTKWHL